MTDEQINQAIAEVCGWRDLAIEGGSGFYKGFDNGAELRPDLPDYVNDLNAMHDAEQHLWRKDYYMRYDYIDELGKLQNPHNWQRMEASDILDVTARERAEAFLKTIGKWEEAK